MAAKRLDHKGNPGDWSGNNGVDSPADINLEIAEYVNEQGTKKLEFRYELEIADPFEIQSMFMPVGSHVK
ncbi:MAG: hypothetical protein ABSH17_15425 [Syntrophobacteraceae bacterium]